MKLLFITQKIDELDDDLAFTIQWVDEFIAAGYDVSVVCLQKGTFDDHFSVYSLGKEHGYGRVRQIMRLLPYVFRNKPDRVFVHMNPEYFTVAGWYWYLRGVPTYLWYTHYTTHIHLKLAAFYTRYMFAATPQSLPQYDGSPKKIITGHGVDTDYWTPATTAPAAPHKLLMVHRLSRSKRVELSILSLLHLPPEYTLTIYGRPVDPDYYSELQALVAERDLGDRVTFKGPLPMPELRTVYAQYGLFLNMASETIDKTMLEAMCSGLFPVTTTGNLAAIGIAETLPEETAAGIAAFITSGTWKKYSAKQLQTIARDRHSLRALVAKLSNHIN